MTKYARLSSTAFISARAVAASIDPDGDDRVRCGFVKTFEPLPYVFDVGFSKARVARAQTSSEDRVGLCHPGQDRVVARPAVVARVRSRHSAFLFAKERRHGGIDVDGEIRPVPVANGFEALLSRELFEVLELLWDQSDEDHRRARRRSGQLRRQDA